MNLSLQSEVEGFMGIFFIYKKTSISTYMNNQHGTQNKYPKKKNRN